MPAKDIIHVIPALTIGGAERMLVDLVNGMADAGHRVRIVVAWKAQDSKLQSAVSRGVEISAMMENEPSTLHRYAKGVWWLIRNRAQFLKADVVHVHLTQASFYGSLLYLVRQVARAESPLIVETYHSVGMPVSKALRWFHRANMRFRDGVVFMASDPYLARLAVAAPGLKVETIQNGVSPKGCSASQGSVENFLHSLGLSRSKNRLIGTISRVVPERRPLEIADVLIGVLREMGPETHAVLGGEGALLRVLREKINTSGVSDRFHLLGLVEDPHTVMSSLSVYLTLNVGETTGISALEAVFCRVPIVALQLEKSHALGPTDWIWTSASVSEVTAECVNLLRNLGRRTSVQEEQFKVAETRFDAKTMVEQYLEFYDGVLLRA